MLSRFWREIDRFDYLTAPLALGGLIALTGGHDPHLALRAWLAALTLTSLGLMVNMYALWTFRPTLKALEAGIPVTGIASFAHDYGHVKRYRNSFALAFAVSVYLLTRTTGEYPFFGLLLVLLTLCIVALVIGFRKQAIFGLILIVRPVFYWLMYGMAVYVLLQGEATEVVQVVLIGFALLADDWLPAALAPWIPDIMKLFN